MKKYILTALFIIFAFITFAQQDISRRDVTATRKILTDKIDTKTGTTGSIDIDGNKWTNSAVASENTDLVPFKQMQDTTVKYLQKKDTLQISLYQDVSGNIHLTKKLYDPYYNGKTIEELRAIGSTIVATPINCNLATATTTLVDGTALYAMFYIANDTIIDGLKTIQTTKGDFTGDNFNGAALFSVSGATYTKILETSNNETFWKGNSSTVIIDHLPKNGLIKFYNPVISGI